MSCIIGLLSREDPCVSDDDCDSDLGLKCIVSFKECGKVGTCECDAGTSWVSAITACGTSKIIEEVLRSRRHR